MKTFFSGIICFILSNVSAQSDSLKFDFASKNNREKVKFELIQKIDAAIELPFVEKNYIPYKGAFWAMELMLYQNNNVKVKIPNWISQLQYATASMQWVLLEYLYTIYPTKYANLLKQNWSLLKSDKVKALALEYIVLNQLDTAFLKNDFFKNSTYYQLFKKLHQQKKITKLFTKNSFLQNAFLPNQTVLVSFQYANRNTPGYLMIRLSNGKWLSDANDKPYQFKQLARSITNLPYYLTNGNTPQGLYKLTGFDSSNNDWIGPTTNLQMLMPFENDGKNNFFTTQNVEQEYRELLGSFAANINLWQSYEAGKIGRTEIIAHGTTIPTDFYKSTTYFPCTPSLGCLCSPEIWDDNGKRIMSIQNEWITLIKKNQLQPHYILVIEH